MVGLVWLIMEITKLSNMSSEGSDNDIVYAYHLDNVLDIKEYFQIFLLNKLYVKSLNRQCTVNSFSLNLAILCCRL